MSEATHVTINADDLDRLTDTLKRGLDEVEERISEYDRQGQAYMRRVLSTMPPADRKSTVEALERMGMTLTGVEAYRGVVTRVMTNDLLTDIQTTGEELAMDLITRLGAQTFDHIGDSFEYHIAAVAVQEALKAVGAAINEVRTSWKEDSAARIKRYRKREAQRRAGQLDMLD